MTRAQDWKLIPDHVFEVFDIPTTYKIEYVVKYVAAPYHGIEREKRFDSFAHAAEFYDAQEHAKVEYVLTKQIAGMQK